jgi:hypothetical protein
LEQRFNIGEEEEEGDEEASQMRTLSDVVLESMALDDDSSRDGSDEASLSSVEDMEESVDDDQSEVFYSKLEDQGMFKHSTIYIYRNEGMLNASIASRKPISGVLQVEEDADGKKAFEFYVAFRKPVKMFARRKVVFNDSEGSHFHGMWYAGIDVEDEHVQDTHSLADIQSAAKMAAMAIPLWYIIGEGKEDSNKYCVITNWWKERTNTGSYALPTLDPSMYGVDIDFEGGDNVI